MFFSKQLLSQLGKQHTLNFNRLWAQLSTTAINFFIVSDSSALAVSPLSSSSAYIKYRPQFLSITPSISSSKAMHVPGCQIYNPALHPSGHHRIRRLIHFLQYAGVGNQQNINNNKYILIQVLRYICTTTFTSAGCVFFFFFSTSCLSVQSISNYNINNIFIMYILFLDLPS